MHLDVEEISLDAKDRGVLDSVRTLGRKARAVLIKSLWSVVVIAVMGACALNRHRIDFTSLEKADRIEVRSRDSTLVKTLTDPSQIGVALEFIREFSRGWGDPLTGPPVPAFMLNFYSDRKWVGAFGIAGSTTIVSDPPKYGFWTREVPAQRMQTLMKVLELTFESK